MLLNITVESLRATAHAGIRWITAQEESAVKVCVYYQVYSVSFCNVCWKGFAIPPMEYGFALKSMILFHGAGIYSFCLDAKK